MRQLIKLIASFFYLGYSPFISGTVASGFALAFYFLLRNNFFAYSILLVAVTALGFLVCGPAEKIFQKKDSERIVIDEVAGLLLAFWAVELDALLIVVGFFIFRALDAFKPYPADRIEKMQGSPGVMGDDLIAGLYTNIALQLGTKIFTLW